MDGSSERVAFPQTGRVLGIDFGTHRVGLAVSTPDQTIASPVETYTRVNAANDAARFRQMIQEYRIVGLIVGLPVHMSGQEGGKAREAREFGDWVARLTGLPVRYFDERFTSTQAAEQLRAAGFSKKKLKARIDKLAAQVLLQAWLDTPDRGTERPPESFLP